MSRNTRGVRCGPCKANEQPGNKLSVGWLTYFAAGTALYVAEMARLVLEEVIPS
jgi:hypothetical protein